MLLHHTEELDDHLRRGADKNLALTAALSVNDAHEGVVLGRALVTFTKETHTRTEILTIVYLKVARRKWRATSV